MSNEPTEPEAIEPEVIDLDDLDPIVTEADVPPPPVTVTVEQEPREDWRGSHRWNTPQ